MKTYSKFIFTVLCSYAFFSCNIINPVEKKPTYVYVDSFLFQDNPKMGSSSHNITNVKVLMDNNTIGVFDLPALIPILMDKSGVLALTPGISYSGLKDVQIPYDFYKTYTTNLDPDPGKTVTILPTTGYYSDTSYNLLIEDFESSNSIVPITGSDTIFRTNVSGEVFEGSYSGKIVIDSADYSEFVMSNSFTAPTEAYLELNYKCSVPFVIGMEYTDANGNINLKYLYGLKAKEEWSKAYIGLQDFIITYPGHSYNIVIQVNPDNASSGYVLLDNLKVISRK